MTFPTRLTFLRIGMTVLVIILLLTPGRGAKISALICFLLAGLTDWLDGYLARRWQQVSSLGALLDPIADKVLVLGIFLAFMQLRLVPAWMVFVILLRELLVTGVRLWAASRHVVLAAAKEGKQKTVAQMGTIFVMMAWLAVGSSFGWESLPASTVSSVNTVIAIGLWVTVVLTVSSGIRFFWRHWATLKRVVSP